MTTAKDVLISQTLSENKKQIDEYKAQLESQPYWPYHRKRIQQAELFLRYNLDLQQRIKNEVACDYINELMHITSTFYKPLHSECIFRSKRLKQLVSNMIFDIMNELSEQELKQFKLKLYTTFPEVTNNNYSALFDDDGIQYLLDDHIKNTWSNKSLKSISR